MNIIEIILLTTLIITGWEITKKVYNLKFKVKVNQFFKNLLK